MSIVADSVAYMFFHWLRFPKCDTSRSSMLLICNILLIILTAKRQTPFVFSPLGSHLSMMLQDVATLASDSVATLAKSFSAIILGDGQSLYI